MITWHPSKILEKHYEKFRSIISLLTLITSINNTGHPTLANSILPSQRCSPFEPTVNVVLDAIAMILVRTNEILAVASVSEQGNHIVAVETVDASNELNDDGLDDWRGISHFIPHVVAIPNPCKDADYIPQDFGTGCKLVNDGAMSRLAHIDTWSDILKLW